MRPMLLWRRSTLLLFVLLFAMTHGAGNLFSASTEAEHSSATTIIERSSAASAIDLSTYVRIGRYNLPVPSRVSAPAGSQLALEASTVTYNPNTDTLFILGDEGTSVVQVTKTGRLVNSMTLTAGDFVDPEGITYAGVANQFVLVEERERQANLFTYVPSGTLSRADVQSVKLGTTVGNIGLEGISLDPQTGGYILVKETNPQGIFQTSIDFGAGTATNGSPATENAANLFDPALAGLTDIADVYAQSNLPAPLTDGNLLVLSQEDGKIVNIDRTGSISNSLTIVSDPDNPLNVAGQGHEGVSMDGDGLLYVVNEQGGGDSEHPQLWVYAPATYVYTNTAPVEVSLSNVTRSLAENSNTSSAIRIGTIVVSDDALGTNVLSLTGANAAVFEIVGTGLFLKAGTALDFETKASYEVIVNVDDGSVGASPDASTAFTLEITDTTDAGPTLIVSEVAPWSSGNSPSVAADWFEVTNVTTGIIDITGWRIDDDSASFANSSALTGVTSIAPGQSVVFVDGDANTITAFVNTWFGGTLPNGVAMGTYGGPGLGTGGDAVNLFDAGGTLVTGVSFGVSPSASPFATFDNAAGLSAISALSVVGVNGAYSVIDAGTTDAAVLIGSPGTISVSPVPLSARVGVAATDAAAAEEAQNPGTFMVLRTGDVTNTLTVSYTIGGDAVAADYTPTLPTSVTIPTGTSQVTITIIPVDDALAEATESLILTLLDGADYDVASNAISATVTIADNDVALADFNLQITEMWPGNSEGDNLTADWFEITNTGSEAWVSGVAPDLYYDDDSQDPAVADLISGLTRIDAGKSAVVVIGNSADAQTFNDIWSPVIDLTGVGIGFTDGAGLGANGDGVSLFVGLPGAGATPVDFEEYPEDSAGRSYDVGLVGFSVAGENGAVATQPNGAGQSAVGSPGRPFVTPGQVLPLSEGFDDCTLSGWSIVSVDADTANTWTCSTNFSNAEANGFGDTVPADEWLITPPLNLMAQDNEQLTFRSQTSFTDSGLLYPQLRVKYSTDYHGGGNPSAATWTDLAGITFSPENSGTWTDSGVIDLSTLTGERVYFAFQYRSSGTGSGTATRWRLDAINFSVTPQATVARIYEIQGSDAQSPFAGQAVETGGIVVADLQGSNQLSGFFLQDPTGDGNSATSDGIFVADTSVAVSVGDIITATGLVTESNGLTQLINVTGVITRSNGNSLPTPAQLQLPIPGFSATTTVSATAQINAYFEPSEGMLVQFSQVLVAAEYFELSRFGSVVLANERLRQFTDQNVPSAIGYEQYLAAVASKSIVLDDDSNTQNAALVDDGTANDRSVFYPEPGGFSTSNYFRGGDTITNLAGVLDYAFGEWRIRPVAEVYDYAFTNGNPRTTAPTAVGGSVKVASFNVLNYFTTLENPGNVCGPTNLECRGANSEAERMRQLNKIVAALNAIDADVFGLIELENSTAANPAGDGNDPVLESIVDALNAVNTGTYDFIDTGVIGTDAIRLAFIYKTDTITPTGDFAILDSSVDSNFVDTLNRPALAQTFTERATNGRLTVVVNHLKSKGSGCGVGDDDTTSGQGNCNGTRTAAATALANWLTTDPTGSGDPDFLIIGDMNAYRNEDPIVALESAGYTDTVEALAGTDAYSYLFDGQLGYLDHALANASLYPQITGVTAWHINADEVNLLDYNDTVVDAGEQSFEKKPGPNPLYDANPYRSSDHDPLIIGLNLTTPAQPVSPVYLPSIFR